MPLIFRRWHELNLIQQLLWSLNFESYQNQSFYPKCSQNAQLYRFLSLTPTNMSWTRHEYQQFYSYSTSQNTFFLWCLKFNFLQHGYIKIKYDCSRGWVNRGFARLFFGTYARDQLRLGASGGEVLLQQSMSPWCSMLQMGGMQTLWRKAPALPVYWAKELGEEHQPKI